MKYFFLLLLPFAAAAFTDQNADQDPLENALVRAQKARAPVLLEFHAPWCYSCYFMAKNVQTGAEWQKVERAMVVVGLDADSPQGARLKEQWQVKALPSYVVLDSGGRELGRILGEQTRADFYRTLDQISRRTTALDTLGEKVRDASPASLQAGRQVLAAYLARRDVTGGFSWQAQLPGAARTALAADPQATLLSQRLALQGAYQSRDVNACLVAGQSVLAGDLGCERPYELDKYISCATERPAAEQHALLDAQKPAMKKLLNERVFGSQPCADERSAVLSAADLYKGAGDAKAEQAVLSHAIRQVEQQLGGDLKKDRNLADNLRVYLDRAGRTTELDATLVRLIAAYPDDYVYPFRHGKNLLSRGKAAEALPFLEKASAKAYGANRLKVAELRAQALLQLKRRDDAKKVISEALVANGPWFPEEAAKLKALLGS